MRRRSVVEHRIRELDKSATMAKLRGMNVASNIRREQAYVLRQSLGKTSRQVKHDMMLTNDEISCYEHNSGLNEENSGGRIFQSRRVNQIRKWMLGGSEE
jgi:hypothetical protein